jgi:hypothetical protein
MRRQRNHFRAALLLVAVACSATACALAVDEESEAGTWQAELHDATDCAPVKLMCPAGYKIKELPSCNLVCVPLQGSECHEDADCGPIYCVTSPCVQPICRGRLCVEPKSKPSDGGGPRCGDGHCGHGEICCNDSCGICSPPDGVCIQTVCM